MSVRASLASLVVLALGLTASAQMNSSRNTSLSNSSISGTVRSIDERPVADVHVEVRNAVGNAIGSAFTDTRGNFTINNLPAGDYEVVAAKGISETRDHVMLQGMPSTVALRIPIRQAAEDGSSTVSVAQFKIPENARKLYLKADEAMKKNKLAESRDLVEKALVAFPAYAEALTLRGILEMNDKNSTAAMSDFDAAIKADPNFAMAYMAMGAALNQAGRYQDASRTLLRAVAVDPSAWQGYFELAKASLGQADYQSALKYSSRACEISQEYPPVHLVKAHALLGMKMYSDSISEFELYLTREPSGPAAESARKALVGVKAFVENSQKATTETASAQ